MQYSTGQIRLEINISYKTKHINKCIDFILPQLNLKLQALQTPDSRASKIGNGIL